MLERKDGIMDLTATGQSSLKKVHRNLPASVLYEHIIQNREGQISEDGAAVVRTGDYAQRPMTDKFVVKDAFSEKTVHWSEEKKSISEEHFNNLAYRLIAYLQNKEVYVQYIYAGRDPEFRKSIRVVTETAWHNLYVRNLFAEVDDVERLDAFDPDFSIVHIPGFHTIPEVDGTRSSAAVVVNVSQKIIFICGTSYAGEIRQAVFTILNYLLPVDKVFAMRCSASVGPAGDVALFVGRGGSGKTALAAGSGRRLLGDHEIGWNDKGLFTFGKGVYAKVLRISPDAEPEIHAAARRFGTILENVSIDFNSREVDLDDGSLTENTRAAFPVSHLSRYVEEGCSGHPSTIFLLTCDPLGVMPPIARLTPELAVYAFMAGYTAHQTPAGPRFSDPGSMFNTCFGTSSLTAPVHVYGNLLLDRLKKHRVSCWLLNTGWSGEPCGKSERIRISDTRKLINAAVSGALEDVEYELDPVFQFEIPMSCPGVPENLLNPRKRAEDEGEYEVRANGLAKEFMKDFSRFENLMPENLRTVFSEVLSPDDSFDLLDEISFSF